MFGGSNPCPRHADETIVPPDVPSYLSSQGTLSDRQEVCIRVESSGGPQPNGHIESNGRSVRGCRFLWNIILSVGVGGGGSL